MKILLCSQYYGEGSVFHSRARVFPLGLAYVASMLKGHEVSVFDANVVRDPLNVLLRRLHDERPEAVGISLRNMDFLNNTRFGKRPSFYPQFRKMLRLIREELPSCKIVVGGPGFSVFSKEIMSDSREIDFGVVFDGETTFANLASDIDHPERVKNLLVRSKSGIVFTGVREPAVFNHLPSPARELFDLSEYRKTPYSLNVQSKRGCVYSCTYCTDPYLGNYTLQLRSASKVVDEIEELVNNYGMKSFWFADPIFNRPPQHGSAICNEIRKRNLDVQWSAYFREDLLNTRLMREAVDAGCTSFEFHSDGACDPVLNFLGKQIKIADIERTIDMAYQVEGARVGYTFFYDLPRGNLGNILAIAKFWAKAMLRCKQKLGYLSTTRMRIYPHTRICEVAVGTGKISPETNMLTPLFYGSNSASALWIQDILTLSFEGSASLLKRFFDKVGINT
jgi:anaerobic magnesium-protoporphyrin IX monomethyl ester cyclase